jgi:hypothetical protein
MITIVSLPIRRPRRAQRHSPSNSRTEVTRAVQHAHDRDAVRYHFVEDHISPERAAKRRGPAIPDPQVPGSSRIESVTPIVADDWARSKPSQADEKPPLIARRTNHFISIYKVSLSP